MISHFCLVSSQSKREARHPPPPSLDKDVFGFLQALLSCVQSCLGKRRGLHRRKCRLAAASIDSRQDACWHFWAGGFDGDGQGCECAFAGVCGTRVGCFGGGGSVTTRVVVFQTGLSSSSGTAVLERFALVLESAVK